MGLTDEILCRALLPSLGWKEGLSVSGDCSSFVCFACVCLCMYVCIYVCFYVCLCVRSPILDPCQHFIYLRKRSHIWDLFAAPEYIHLPDTWHLSLFLSFAFENSEASKGSSLLQNHALPLLSKFSTAFKFKFLITFWLQKPLSLLNVSSLSSENFFNALLKYY